MHPEKASDLVAFTAAVMGIECSSSLPNEEIASDIRKMISDLEWTGNVMREKMDMRHSAINSYGAFEDA